MSIISLNVHLELSLPLAIFKLHPLIAPQFLKAYWKLMSLTKIKLFTSYSLSSYAHSMSKMWMLNLLEMVEFALAKSNTKFAIEVEKFSERQKCFVGCFLFFHLLSFFSSYLFNPILISARNQVRHVIANFCTWLERKGSWAVVRDVRPISVNAAATFDFSLLSAVVDRAIKVPDLASTAAMLVLKRLGISGGTSAGVNLMVSLHLAATRRYARLQFSCPLLTRRHGLVMHAYRTADTRVVTCYVRVELHSSWTDVVLWAWNFSFLCFLVSAHFPINLLEATL